jgi:hypothetical protein
MKFISLKNAPNYAASKPQFLFLLPMPSTETCERKTKIEPQIIRQLLKETAITFVLFVAAAILYSKFVPELKPSTWVQGYLAIAPLYLMGQFLSLIIELALMAHGHHYPGHFRFPPFSKSLPEFWSKRWAVWVSDWFRQNVHRKYSDAPLKGLFWSFLISGLWHEALINVPYLIFYGKNLLGSMTAYFLIQVVAMIAERKINFPSVFAHRAYVWAATVLPAPLVLNESLLRMYGLWVAA